jgi:hypothetical protein
MPHGPPTQDVVLAVFAAIDVAAFEAVFRLWVSLLRTGAAIDGKQIAVDGK